MSSQDAPEQQRPASWSPSLWITVVAWVGLIVLAAVVVCVVLTLLGPAIGNIFSNSMEQPYF